MEPFTPDGARTFLHRVRNHRLYALWVLVLLLGLRRSEVCGLHWSNTRRSKHPAASGRDVDALREHRDRQAEERADTRRGWIDTPYVFTSAVGTPLEPRTLTRTFHALCTQHGLRRVRLHDLRPDCVSLLLSFGVHPRVVMEIVGHSAIEMTMNVYGPVTLDTQRAALDLFNDRMTNTRTVTNDVRCCHRPLSASVQDLSHPR